MTLFRQLIAEPLQDVGHNSHMAVVLDALDECDCRGPLLDIVKNEWRTCIPKWLGLVVSTRPEVPIEGDEVPTSMR